MNPQKHHIVIDARIINSSTGTYVERLLTYLQNIDQTNQYTVLVPAKDLNYWNPTNPNFKIMAADFKNYSLSEQIGFKKFLNSLSPDLVHFCMPQQPVLYHGKKVTTFHDLTLLNTYNSDKNWLVFHIKQMVGRFVFKSVAKSSNQIITPTKFTKDSLIEFAKINPDKVTVTYEAADAFIDKLTPYNHPFKQFILYVGQQSDYKNIRRLGDAHQRLLSKYPDLGLILVGKLNASANKNKAYFESQNYHNILFTDFIPNDQRDWLYTQAAAYIFPSLMEGFGLPGLEAMAYGTPVVCSRASCLPEVYGDAAVYFDPTIVANMADKIESVITNNNLRLDLINRGKRQIMKYSWQKMAQETYEVYMKALNKQ